MAFWHPPERLTPTRYTAHVRPIVFFYPSRILGGTEVLFTRLAAHLHAQHMLEVSVVDHADGVVISGLTGTCVQRLEMGEVPRDACLVVPVSHVRHACRSMRMQPDTRLMLWGLHPHNLRWLFPGHELWRFLTDAQLPNTLRLMYPRAYRAVRNSLNLSLKHGGLAVMDGENHRALQEAFKLDGVVPYLPIPLPEAPDFAITHGSRLVWLGRISEDKICALERVLNDAEAYAQMRQTRIEVDVIGSGPSITRLHKAARRWPDLNLRLLGTLTGQALENHLRCAAQVVFAMGTSLLEAARLGLPAVLVDVSFEPLPEGLPFRWAFQIEDFTLGQLVSRCHPPTQGVRFPEIMHALSNATERERIARACHAHVKTHHSITNIGARAAQLFESSQLRVSMLRQTGLF
jgi:glycosyltransferase involved in cell wall biosynthesis